MNNQLARKKTYREWLEILPEPYRTQAIENCDYPNLGTLDSKLSGVISSSNYWLNTPQGYEYWKALHNYIKALENHDWYSGRSDSSEVAKRGRDELSRISQIGKTIDPNSKLYNHYCPWKK